MSAEKHMSNTVVPLDVFLRGTRDYVQGTQLIVRAAEALTGDDWLFDRAVFSQITDRKVELSMEKPDQPVLGTLRFKRNDETADLFLISLDEAAPKSDLPLGIEVAATESFCDPATYHFTGANGLEGVLNVIVQAIKAEHTVRYPLARDIWLTGMRGFSCSTKIRPSGEGVLEMKLLRTLAKHQNVQTLWSVSLIVNGLQVETGNVTFNYKQAGA